MAATPKHKRSKTRQRTTRAQKWQTWARNNVPQLVKLENGRLVPAHTVTPLNPVYKGVKFLRGKVKKA